MNAPLDTRAGRPAAKPDAKPARAKRAPKPPPRPPVVVILGALSAMAEHVARLHAAQGDALVIVARHPDRLETVASDLLQRGAARCETHAMDLNAVDGVPMLMSDWRAGMGAMDRVYVFYGLLGDQKQAEGDPVKARALLETNFSSAAEWCLAAANIFEAQKSGVLVVAGSVAGDRGRQSNAIYGAAKAGIAVLTQGLDHRLAKAKAKAVAVKLGFVATPMTDGMPRGGPLWASADRAARLIKKAADQRRGVVYAPWFWRWILLIIRAVPAPIFNRTKL